MPKAFVTFEVKGTEMTLKDVELFTEEVKWYFKPTAEGVQQIKLGTVIYDTKGTYQTT